MRVLVVCNEGNNRSVTVMHQLRYWNHDVLSAGLDTNSRSTLIMLMGWAERVIATDRYQLPRLPEPFRDKVQLWDIGPDNFPRPFNKDLLTKVRRLMELHRDEYKTQA